MESQGPRTASVVDLAKAGTSILHGAVDILQALVNAGIDLGQGGGNDLIDRLQEAAKKVEEAAAG